MEILVLSFTPVALSLLVFLWLLVRKPRSKLDACRRIFTTFLLIFLLIQIAPWVLINHNLPWLALLLFVVGALFHLFRSRKTRLTASFVFARTTRNSAFVLILLFLNLYIEAGRNYTLESSNMAFPLKNGRYHILQGGSNPITNPFHHFADNRYALDIIKVNKKGERARQLIPKTLDDFYSFGEPVYTTCAGKVIKAVDGIKDNPIGQIRKIPHGNHVIIKCEKTTMIYSHLKNGSLSAKTGSDIAEGVVIGKIGNSGYSNEPHLHIEATAEHKDGDTVKTVPVGIKLNKRTFSINDYIDL